MSWPTPAAVKLIDAMVVAEGGPKAFVRAVKCSIPSVTDYADARDIAANTIAHAALDFAIHAGWQPFVQYLASRPDPTRPGKNTGWAPVGADNDPTHLNENWVPNVLRELHTV